MNVNAELLRAHYCRRLNDEDLRRELGGKRFLVTGGAGSIGAALAAKLAAISPGRVVVFDNDETRLERVRRRVPRVRVFLGDVRDPASVAAAVEGVDIVFHAAALKHVPLSEVYPMEYVKTNIIGTQNVLNAAARAGVEKVIYISTDKAVNPANVMGATKLLGEKLAIAHNLTVWGRARTRYAVVRFGNVIYTRGGVVEIFLEQACTGGPVTVTDPSMTRFIMRVDDAVRLILQATVLAEGGETFILKMPAVRIGDLAHAVVEVAVERLGLPKLPDIKVVGRRPGEKMHELLMTEEEAERALECKDMYVILSELVLGKQGKQVKLGRPVTYSSRNAPKLSHGEIKSIIEEVLEEVLKETNCIGQVRKCL